MIRWRAVVPIKTAEDRKTRLSSRLSLPARVDLTEAMLAHVLEAISGCEDVEDVRLLAPEPPREGGYGWLPDQGRGLNRELAALAATAGTPLLVIHADLPGLACADIRAMTRTGYDITIAADRHGSGTNGLALRRPDAFAFRFGLSSLSKHRDRPGEAVAVLGRPGLAVDIDLPADIDLARRLFATRLRGSRLGAALEAVAGPWPRPAQPPAPHCGQ